MKLHQYRKSGKEEPSDLRLNLHARVRIESYEPNNAIQFIEEFATEVFLSCFVPLDCVIDLSIGKAEKADFFLTSGLVLVNEGAKYLLVEDEADKVFYSHIFNELLAAGVVDSEVPLIFIPASTKTSSGGKSVVAGWVKKLQGQVWSEF
jgi:hypothetical protein